jgi:hypothetical protein
MSIAYMDALLLGEFRVYQDKRMPVGLEALA